MMREKKSKQMRLESWFMGWCETHGGASKDATLTLVYRGVIVIGMYYLGNYMCVNELSAYNYLNL